VRGDWKWGPFPACPWLALVAGVGGYVLAGVEMGVVSCTFSTFVGVRVVGRCVLLYVHTHTQTTWVLDVSPGVGQTPGEPEESKSTKAQYRCRPYICVQSTFVYIYAGLWVLMIWANCFFLLTCLFF